MKKNTTRQLLADALLKIAKHKDVDKITIKEIVELCGLSSQTFYNHFSDKYELILWIHKSIGDELIDELEKGEITMRELSIRNLEFYASHASFMLNALSNTHGGDSYRMRSSENAINVLEAYIKRKFSLKELPSKERMQLRMYVYGTTEICAHWASNGISTPVETMSDVIMSALPESLKKYLS